MLPVYGDRKPFEFLGTEFNEQGGQFSPDGQWLAFTSNRSGQDEVYVTSFPDPERSGFYQVSSDGGVEPVWSREGDEIFYRSGDRLMVADILDERISDAVSSPMDKLKRKGHEIVDDIKGILDKL